MAAPISGIFWLHFCTVGGSGGRSSIFLCSLWFKLGEIGFIISYIISHVMNSIFSSYHKLSVCGWKQTHYFTKHYNLRPSVIASSISTNSISIITHNRITICLTCSVKWRRWSHSGSHILISASKQIWKSLNSSTPLFWHLFCKSGHWEQSVNFNLQTYCVCTAGELLL